MPRARFAFRDCVPNLAKPVILRAPRRWICGALASVAPTEESARWRQDLTGPSAMHGTRFARARRVSENDPTRGRMPMACPTITLTGVTREVLTCLRQRVSRLGV